MKAQYRKKTKQIVVGVQLDLVTDGFTYEKWGFTQTCKPGDWLVNNDGEVYTVDQQVFADTYQQVGPGHFIKTQIIWAEVASKAGVIKTLEGSTAYQPGDYLVDNDGTGQDMYAVTAEKFLSMYDPVEE